MTSSRKAVCMLHVRWKGNVTVTVARQAELHTGRFGYQLDLYKPHLSLPHLLESWVQTVGKSLESNGGGGGGLPFEIFVCVCSFM